MTAPPSGEAPPAGEPDALPLFVSLADTPELEAVEGAPPEPAADEAAAADEAPPEPAAPEPVAEPASTAGHEPPEAPVAAPGPARPAEEAQAHTVTVYRSARYYSLGGGGDVSELWYVLHGYGQLAAPFLRAFGVLADGHRRIVAPEALSRFYLDAAHTRVGATWMTREDRLHEIDDYLAYLDALHARLQPEAPEATVHLLGFSQGCETAARWATLGALRPSRLILWGGRLPADLALAEHRDTFRHTRLLLVYGTDDPYVTPARLAEEEARLNRHTIPYHSITFEGGHRLDADVLSELAQG